MTLQRVIAIVVTFVLTCLVGFGILFWLVFPKMDSAAAAGIVGTLGGALVVTLGSAMASFVDIWARSRDVEERLKDRVSKHALELTRMDYELREKSLDLSKTKQQFLAPAKVYRELYKALLELHKTGTWPKTIQDLGLLNIFELGAEQGEQDKK